MITNWLLILRTLLRSTGTNNPNKYRVLTEGEGQRVIKLVVVRRRERDTDISISRRLNRGVNSPLSRPLPLHVRRATAREPEVAEEEDPALFADNVSMSGTKSGNRPV